MLNIKVTNLAYSYIPESCCYVYIELYVTTDTVSYMHHTFCTIINRPRRSSHADSANICWTRYGHYQRRLNYVIPSTIALNTGSITPIESGYFQINEYHIENGCILILWVFGWPAMGSRVSRTPRASQSIWEYRFRLLGDGFKIKLMNISLYMCTYLHFSSCACTLPPVWVQSGPLLLQGENFGWFGVDQTETSNIDSAMAKVIYGELVHCL